MIVLPTLQLRRREEEVSTGRGKLKRCKGARGWRPEFTGAVVRLGGAPIGEGLARGEHGRGREEEDGGEGGLSRAAKRGGWLWLATAAQR